MTQLLASRLHLLRISAPLSVRLKILATPLKKKALIRLSLIPRRLQTPHQWKPLKTHRGLAKNNFRLFTTECLVERSKSIDDMIYHNKLKLFGSATKKNVNKGKQQLTSLKSDVRLFSWLYIGCQTRDGNLEEFFHHENQASPSPVSDGGNLHLGCKRELLICLEGLCETQTEPPVKISIIVDEDCPNAEACCCKKLCRICL